MVYRFSGPVPFRLPRFPGVHPGENPRGARSGGLRTIMQPEPVTASPMAASPALPRPAPKGYIVNPLYDWAFFIASPVLALAMGMAISGTSLSREPVVIFGHTGSITNIFIGAFIFAHLVIVFFRSHGNQNIFRQFPIRFTVVPLALFAAMLFSKWVMVAVTVLAVWWDVYHSSLQTFGLGRIYDARRGNEPNAGRRLDYLLNILLYAGPILAGATMMDHVGSFEKFSDFGEAFLSHIPAYAETHSRWMTWGVLAVGVPFLIFYLVAYWRLARQGYQVSYQKVWLYVATAVCSIAAWGYNSFGEAFFIMNFFHAWQYFAIVWWSEQKSMLRLFGLAKVSWGKPIALALFVLLGCGYGLWAEVSDAENNLVISIILVVSIMHFWYDGFIWSVRKKHV